MGVYSPPPPAQQNLRPLAVMQGNSDLACPSWYPSPTPRKSHEPYSPRDFPWCVKLLPCACWFPWILLTPWGVHIMFIISRWCHIWVLWFTYVCYTCAWPLEGASGDFWEAGLSERSLSHWQKALGRDQVLLSWPCISFVRGRNASHSRYSPSVLWRDFPNICIVVMSPWVRPWPWVLLQTEFTMLTHCVNLY